MNDIERIFKIIAYREKRLNNQKRGSRLKECRESRHLTQEELAKKVDFSSNYVRMLERGERAIDWDKAILFSKALNISPDYIMCVDTDVNNLCRTCSKSDKCRSAFVADECEQYAKGFKCSEVMNLFNGMSDSMKTAVVEIMKVSQKGKNKC